MNFIIDAQLPQSLSAFLNEKGYDSIHTLDLPDRNRTKDSEIAQLAKKENRILISKDTDFLESYLIKSEPEKLILIKTGNITNGKLIKLFGENLERISVIMSRSNLIEFTSEEIIEHE